MRRKAPDALRIHFAAVSTTGVDQTCGPLRDLRADHAYVLRRSTFSREGEYLEDVTVERLEDAGIEVSELYVDMDDPALVAADVAEVVEEQPRMSYRFNLSTGPRGATIAGVLLATFWPVQPYMAHVNKSKESETPDGYPYSGYTDFPTFKQDPPRDAGVRALQYLVDEGGRTSQSSMIEDLHGRGFIRPEKPGVDRLSPQAKQGQFRTIMKELRELGFARKEKEGNRAYWEVTQEGEMGLKLFGGEVPA